MIRRVRKALVLLFALPFLAWLGFRALVAWWPYPSGIDRPPVAGTFIEDRDGRPLAAFAAADGQWRIPLAEDQISPHLLDAIVAIEDSRFYSHRGVDWRSVAMAACEDLRARHIRRGASTLAMQVQRLRDPRPRTFFNKFEQAIRAEQIENRQSKKQTLVEYVNRAPFGGNLVGAGAASWRYFGRPCSQLSLAEAALLAGLPQSPNRLRPDRHPRQAVARRNRVLDRMLALGMIDRQQHDRAVAEPAGAAWRPLPQDREGNEIIADGALPTLLGLSVDHPGQTVIATLDSAVQRQTEQAAFEQLSKLESSNISAAAVVVLDTQTAECLAAVSLSRGTELLDLTRRPRSSGSTLKPFIYAAAFEAGVCQPSTQLEDSPAAWAGYEPADYDRRFRGSMTAAEALAESRNIPAMVVLANVGIQNAVGVMDAAGLKTLARSPERYGLSLAIGGAEVSPMELAQGYAMLGRGGVAKDVRIVFADLARSLRSPRPVLRERDRVRVCAAEGLRPSPQPSPGVPGEGVILSPITCWQTLVALSAMERTAGICPSACRSHVAWKTGTSSGHRDAWCAAVTRRRTVVVWLGNAGGQGSSALVGAESAAPLALSLIASLDGAEEPWPADEISPALDPAGHETMARAAAPVSLTLVSPARGQQFVLDPDSSSDHQRVLLKAAMNQTRPGSGGESRTLWWFVDGQPIGVADAGAQLWWPPTPGMHEVRVIDAHGHAAVASVGVR